MSQGKTKPVCVIIGQGAAGAAAANELKRLDSDSAVMIVSNEREGFYSRIDLPDIIGGRREAREALLQRPGQFQEKGIDCVAGEPAVRICPGDRSVELSSGRRLHYDRLLLATGARPVVPRLPGMNADGVFALWTLAQAEAISQAATAARAAVVIGAGLIGLKTALALRKRGLRVTVVERMDRVLPQQLDAAAAAILEAAVRAGGVELLTSVQVNAVETSGGRVTGIRTGSRQLPCELVICAAGVKPETALAETADLALGAGIVTDACLRTSQDDVYAAGDAAEVADIRGQRTTSAGWPAAVEQGIIAARNMAGGQEQYAGYVAANSVEIAGVPLVSAGYMQNGSEAEILVQQDGNAYRRLIVKNNRLQGFVLMGDIRQSGVLAGVLARQDVLRPGKALDYIELLAL
ncbi:NAD(P)/FAD-dependent oxidoreductase [Acetonema longum]|uniref:NADH oxidase n=1 Tax=Acetonema longum DSM 6540 TaxID=1009370 RepID=F7NE21_9FIRM|nr:FAD-dependent oxidoreductase [Acetonema longum]EGO65676.1 NADH oxidase [Acetonema longum DSM 6540]